MPININENKEVAVFGGGCFWCTEAVFKMLKGVESVSPGYAGGTIINPTYEQVSRGLTGHIECIKIEFDPKEISYKELLTVFFGSHDPTTLNRQGNDIGTQYRSVIFYTTQEQKEIAENFVKELNESPPEQAENKGDQPIVTEVAPLDVFYVAENYHQDYYERNKEVAYCQIVINPKLEKVQHSFAELLKTHNK